MNKKFLIICFLLANIILGQEINFVSKWGSANVRNSYVNDQYVYLSCEQDGYKIINITDIFNPRKVGEIISSHWIYQSIIKDSLAYIANGYSGLTIYDISNPISLLKIGEINNDIGSPNATAIIENNGFIYLGADRIHIIDIDNPTNPIEIGRFDEQLGRIYKLAIANNYLFVASQYGFLIIDINDNTNPLKIFHIQNSYDYPEFRSVTISDNYVFLLTISGNLRVFDIEDINNPTEVDINGNFGGLDIIIRGSYAFLSGFDISIINISNLSEIFEVVNINIDEIYAAWSISLQNDFLFLSGQTAGLYIYDISSLTTINLVNNHTSEHYRLYQNYPNPFNPKTKIKYTIPQNGYTKLSILNLLGEEVKSIVDKYHYSGNYEIEFNTEKLSSGVYFYRLLHGSYSEIKKMVVLK